MLGVNLPYSKAVCQKQSNKHNVQTHGTRSRQHKTNIHMTPGSSNHVINTMHVGNPAQGQMCTQSHSHTCSTCLCARIRIACNIHATRSMLQEPHKNKNSSCTGSYCPPKVLCLQAQLMRMRPQGHCNGAEHGTCS